MSRIHEALLKAQTEHGIESGILDVENLPLNEPEGPVGLSGAGIDATAAGVGTGKLSTFENGGDAPQVFRQCSWEPDRERLVFLKPELSAGIEEFRTLRSRLLRERSQRSLKTVLITGATAGEGKSFVTANLALAMSRNSSSRVLIIDADLRRSSLHSIFGMERSPGLSGYLSGLTDEMAVVRQTPEPQLCVVTSGRHSATPTELLHSRRMHQFLENMSRNFDWIFIDSPPAATVSDGEVLSEICDGVIMVITPGTPVYIAQKSRKQIGQKILGVVLNRAKGTADYYNYYISQNKATKPRKSAPPRNGDRRPSI